MKLKNHLSLVLVLLPVLLLLVFTGPLPAAGPVPDTGQSKFYNNSGEISKPAPGEDFSGQDAQYNVVERQHSYVKLDVDGNALQDSATIWYQVKDNVTGLIWEVKQNKDDIADYSNPCDADNRYTWYDSNPATNGGYAGTSGDGTDTEDFINDLNGMNGGVGYCDHNDWRLPTFKELSWIVDSGSVNPADIMYFPCTVSSDYWSSTVYAYIDPGNNKSFAWVVSFASGRVNGDQKKISDYVRAVRSEP